MMTRSLSRRDFLKLSGLALSGLAFLPVLPDLQEPLKPGAPFTPVFPLPLDQDQGKLARVAVKEIDLRSQPNDTSPIIGKRYRDQLVHVYAEVTPPDAPQFYNRLWYKVWGGYIHSAHLQIVQVQLNDTVNYIPEAGHLAEVTVPYTISYNRSEKGVWSPWRGSRLYYESTHWTTGVVEGPDGEPWYQITSELTDSEIYYAPGKHLRLIPPEEYAPLSPQVPADKKRVEVDLSLQLLRAFEYDKEVYRARISSGIPRPNAPESDTPTATPKGRFVIYSKMPSKHMGSVAGGPDVENNPDRFSLPGVPWTSFFRDPGGYALHGTYWHNNFGLQMSHGCINMRNADAKWLFRWSTPVYPSEIKSHRNWEQTGAGTSIYIF